MTGRSISHAMQRYIAMNNIIDENIIAIDAESFDPDVTFDCGQCFRWNKRDDGAWSGIAYGTELTVKKSGDRILIEGADQRTFDKIFRDYFDLDRDYEKICGQLCEDPVLAKAIKFAPGIRILRQEPWETLCSFVISINNNIPRIKGIVARLCEIFGERLPGGGYAFPKAETVAGLTKQDLAPLRCGFRADYILDAARFVADGRIDFDELSEIPLDLARKQLKQIYGVGPKVADCVLLFGCGRLDAFPIDVWIKRVLAQLYPDGFPQKYMVYGGIAQQFLFNYARCCPDALKA